VHREGDAASVEGSEDLDQLLTREVGSVRVVRADVGVDVEQGGAVEVRQQRLEPRLQQRFVDRGGQGASL
jgi:hypothetical protein